MTFIPSDKSLMLKPMVKFITFCKDNPGHLRCNNSIQENNFHS